MVKSVENSHSGRYLALTSDITLLSEGVAATETIQLNGLWLIIIQPFGNLPILGMPLAYKTTVCICYSS